MATRLLAAAGLACALSGCGYVELSSIGQGRINPFQSRDASLYGINREPLNPHAAAADALIGPDGRCVSGPGVQVEPTPPPAAPPAPGAPTQVNPAAPPGADLPAAPPVIPRGVGLGMTECQVVNRLGPTPNFVVGATDRGERSVTLTYVEGTQPGIYHFVSGVLTAVDAAPPPPKPVKPVRKTRKVVKKKKK